MSPAFVGMAIHSYSMPLRSYFLVIGPALAACLWFVSSFLEPARPPQARSTAPAAAKPSVAPVQAASPALVTAARAAPQPGSQPQDKTPAVATPPAAGTRAAPAELAPAEGTRSAHAAEATSRSTQAAKHKKRKQTAQRRQHRETYGSAYPEPSPYPAYASRYPYYAPSQPFYGYRSW